LGTTLEVGTNAPNEDGRDLFMRTKYNGRKEKRLVEDEE
jgi:hypothetical protein